MTLWRRSMTSQRRQCESSIWYVLRLTRGCRHGRLAIRLDVHWNPTFLRLSSPSFRVSGSAGGPDGLRPQHVKDLMNASAGDAGRRLLTRLTEFASLCLTGRIPAGIQLVFCSASLYALNKKDSGIRSIAAGSTLRCLVAQSACRTVTAKMEESFLPIQCGFGLPQATEAAAHATRQYIADLQPRHSLLKLDFSNASNTIHREAIFDAIRQELPELQSFVHMCYNNTSLLSFG
jgi:hypothetical protein